MKFNSGIGNVFGHQAAERERKQRAAQRKKVMQSLPADFWTRPQEPAQISRKPAVVSERVRRAIPGQSSEGRVQGRKLNPVQTIDLLTKMFRALNKEFGNTEFSLNTDRGVAFAQRELANRGLAFYSTADRLVIA